MLDTIARTGLASSARYRGEALGVGYLNGAVRAIHEAGDLRGFGAVHAGGQGTQHPSAEPAPHPLDGLDAAEQAARFEAYARILREEKAS